MRAGPPGQGTAVAHRPTAALLYSAIGLMTLFWSLNYIVGKFALREFPAILVAGLRTAMAALMILPVYGWRKYTAHSVRGSAAVDTRSPSRERSERIGLRAYLVLGVAGVALNQLFFSIGLNRTSVAHASLLIGTTPIIVLLIAAARGMERLSALSLTGMIVAAGGVALLNTAPSKAARASISGDVIVLCGATSFAIFVIAGKRMTGCADSITVTTGAFVIGALALAPVTIWRAVGFDFSAVSARAWLSLVYMAAFPSIVCYLIFYWALIYIPASRVSSFSYLQPLIATLLAAPLLSEPVSLWLGFGGALILLGVFLTERQR